MVNPRNRRNAASWNVPRVDLENQSVSREEALKRFRSLDETIQIEDVQLVVRVGVTFTYESDRGSISMTWIDLPPRWSGPAAGRRATGL